MTDKAKQPANKYFDLHTTGIGYLNRIREVPVKKGNSFWACNIAALRGSSDDVEYTYFDCKVSGTDAANLMQRCNSWIEKAEKLGKPEPKILIGFNIGDIYTETFTYGSGKKKGETGVSLKGRLVYISFITIDGIEVYRANKKDDNAEEVANDQVDHTAPSTADAEVNSKPTQAQPEEEPQAPIPVEDDKDAEIMDAF